MKLPKLIENNARFMVTYGSKEILIVFDEKFGPFYLLSNVDGFTSSQSSIPMSGFVRGVKKSNGEYEFVGHGSLWSLIDIETMYKLLDDYKTSFNELKPSSTQLEGYQAPTFLVGGKDNIKKLDGILEKRIGKLSIQELYEIQAKSHSTVFDIHSGFLKSLDQIK